MTPKNVPVYTIGDFQYSGNSNEFYFNALSAHLERFTSVITPHKHNFFFAVYVTQGSGTHEIDFNQYPIRPGTVFIVSPGQVHTWEVSDDIDGYLIFHSQEFYDLRFTNERVRNFPFYCSLQNAPVIFPTPHSKTKLDILFNGIREEYESQQLMKLQKIHSLLNLLYIEFTRSYMPQLLPAKLMQQYLTKIHQLEKLIDDHYKTVKSPSAYAEMMHITERHLNRICKLYIGKNISTLIIDRVLLEAKRMLVYSEFSVAQIADELGYVDHAYFTRLFKKRSGETPSSFIQRYRKDRDNVLRVGLPEVQSVHEYHL